MTRFNIVFFSLIIFSTGVFAAEQGNISESEVMTRTGSYFFSGPHFTISGREYGFSESRNLFKNSPIAAQYYSESQDWYKAYKNTQTIYAIVGGISFAASVVFFINFYNSDSFGDAIGNGIFYAISLVTFGASTVLTMILTGIQMSKAMEYADKAVNAYNSGRGVSMRNAFKIDTLIPIGQNGIKFREIRFLFPIAAFTF